MCARKRVTHIGIVAGRISRLHTETTSKHDRCEKQLMYSSVVIQKCIMSRGQRHVPMEDTCGLMNQTKRRHLRCGRPRQRTQYRSIYLLLVEEKEEAKEWERRVVVVVCVWVCACLSVCLSWDDRGGERGCFSTHVLCARPMFDGHSSALVVCEWFFLPPSHQSSSPTTTDRVEEQATSSSVAGTACTAR